MLYTDDLRLEKFGNYLRELRINKGVTVRDIYLKTKIDITTLSRLENGLIKKINPNMLLLLADYYNTNVIVFYNLLGFLNNNLVTEYVNNISEKNKDFSIPLFSSIYEIDNFNKKVLRNINLPIIENQNNDFFSFQFNDNTIIIFSYIDSLNNGEIGILKIADDYIISPYNEKDEVIAFLNHSKLCLENKDKVKILGKVFYEIKKHL